MNMSKIVRYEFVGSWMLFWLFCISGIALPLAVLYLINGTIRIEEEMENPNQFVADLRSARQGKR